MRWVSGPGLFVTEAGALMDLVVSHSPIYPPFTPYPDSPGVS